ncbi:hypothetical protein SAMN04515647_2731 [Cohaesibacter sp. ES.047]|uniref:hypothetical protein n=1 Tax=Cohaesibacter sp. ES.047 TaxID=1798205 RepID=UPI000BB8143B|nr:hypothetical protein [Cohaesibacter sp. ES.047]SNY92458.1 hypothetical protein SAMN04515647_2731 [Cohaesibacter sp. ES.047]
MAKILVLVGLFGGAWFVLKLLKQLGQKDTELDSHRKRETKRVQRETAEKEADIIDLEEDPETGDFREK